MISILVCSRVEGNVNHRLMGLFSSLAEHTAKPNQLEVLVKFDSDDPGAGEANFDCMNSVVPFQVKTCYGPRGRGYIDIHHGYNQLMGLVSPEASVIGAMADDFTVNPGWDASVTGAVDGAGEYFIVHQATRNTRFASATTPSTRRISISSTRRLCGRRNC